MLFLARLFQRFDRLTLSLMQIVLHKQNQSQPQALEAPPILNSRVAQALQQCPPEQRAAIIAVLCGPMNGCSKPGRAVRGNHRCADVMGNRSGFLSAREMKEFGMSRLSLP